MKQSRFVENVKKLLDVGSNSSVTAISLLLILISLALSTPTPCRAATLLVRWEFASEIELATPLVGEMKVEDVKIQNVLRYSYICVNEEDSPFPLNVSKRTFLWKSDNLTVQSAIIVDNLGNSFTPLTDNDYIMNSNYEVTIAPHSMYNASLIMVLLPGALYYSSFQAWSFGVYLRSELPVKASITVPTSFSVPFYTVGAEYDRDQNHKILSWQNSPPQALNVTVVFLPFLYNPETKSFNFSMDISAVFPIVANIKATVTQEFGSLSEYNGLKAPQIFKLPVLFPPSGKNVTVLSVYDIDGQCMKLSDPLSEINYVNQGTYYPDYKNREVIVYPRANTYENHYDYAVSVTFDFGNDVPANVTFGPLMPYDCTCKFNVINVSATGDWKQNLTQNIVVEFQLPQGTQPYQNDDYTIDYENGRYTVRFVNASSELTSGKWEINFVIIRLQSFFDWEMLSIAYLAIMVTIMVVLHFVHPAALLKSKWKLQLGDNTKKVISYLTTLGIGPGLIVYEVTILGDWFWDVVTQKTIFTLLLSLQVGLTVAVFVLAQEWKFKQQTKGEGDKQTKVKAEKPKDEKTSVGKLHGLPCARGLRKAKIACHPSPRGAGSLLNSIRR